MGTIIAPHFVSRVLSLCGHSRHRVVVAFVAWLQWVSLCHVVSQSGLLRGCGGCHRAMLCCSRDGCVMQHDVTVMVVALHGGVMVMVVALHGGVVVVVIAPH